MHYLNELIKTSKKYNLIEYTSDIDFLFLDFKFNEDEPIDSLIDKVLEWGYENNKLEDFFLENWEILVDTELVTIVKDCTITDNEIYSTSIILSKVCSKNKYYYRIDASGIHKDMFNTLGYYSIEDYEDDEKLISMFREDCIEAYTCQGDFTEEEMLERSSTIDFS